MDPAHAVFSISLPRASTLALLSCPHARLASAILSCGPLRFARSDAASTATYYPQNTRETALAVQGYTLKKAYDYLQAVKEMKRCIPFRRFKGGVGRTAQAKEFGLSQGRWPIKSVEIVLGLLQNAESNAKVHPPGRRKNDSLQNSGQELEHRGIGH